MMAMVSMMAMVVVTMVMATVGQSVARAER
jgi:hypothetical protein